MRVAYIRVSTQEQNEARQFAALEPYKIEKYFSEKVSGKNMNREQLKIMLDFVREGDIVYVMDFSRLSRSVGDLLSLLQKFQDKKVHLISLKENFDTTTPTGRLMTVMLSAINEFERANILERQAEGIALAKQKGVYKGRKRIEKPAEWPEVFKAYQTRQMTAAAAMKRLNLKRNTFYNFVKTEAAGYGN